MTSPAPSGAQHELVSGDVRAVVTEVGGGLRELSAAGRHLVRGFPVQVPRPLYRGSVLAPWPNRVGDGRYSFAGTEQQLALTEPDRGNALHGLLCWTPWTLVDRTASTLRLGARIWPQQGWPHLLDVEVDYELTGAGLRWTVVGRNVGGEPAPWASSVHPYLVAGPGRVDDWELELHAAQVLTVDDERLLPTGLADVATTDLDFRSRRSLRGLAVDHAYTGLGSSERVSARVWSADGTGVAMHWSPSQLPWVQVHTADRPDPADDRVGLAVEPMTCPPDALRTGTDLVVLEPGAVHTATWEIEALSR
ncbi:aldose 1-epimerase family protein [Klenkia taihuensis]|uniref:Aldose 1-epimerase n=1 Tax=Klenkia taihuensis TaxID=1225127 RepID=A0A1I1UVY3_9ACTN|nr:aldose 1-epimerase family protein [Klenkia taihuensis]GHE13931.1 galactose mutarotase [Klenkia taihuensis]SFD73013.1 aldose 1-epimerase [Klenkia taihuensis]